MSLTVRFLDKSPQPKKRRRHREGPPDGIQTLPAAWRALAARWLRDVADKRRWETLAKAAGPEGYPLAQRLLDWLLNAGWAAVVEERRHGAWWPNQVEFLDPPTLRRALGLPDAQAAAERWEGMRAQVADLASTEFDTAVAALDDLPPTRAADRAELVIKLNAWREEQRCGTRRDFAHFARGDTKAITDAEWRWLEEAVDLAAFAIERHTPLLLIAAPLVLEMPTGVIDTGCSPDFAALTPASLAATRTIRGKVDRWRLVENRTSFERLARKRDENTGVVWLPGFPPDWWCAAMAHLLELAPASGEIACDPDPAGIAIACKAGELWERTGLSWAPWRMDAQCLANLPSRRLIGAADRALLDRFEPHRLPSTLAELRQWMLDHGEKGEQEGYL